MIGKILLFGGIYYLIQFIVMFSYMMLKLFNDFNGIRNEHFIEDVLYSNMNVLLAVSILISFSIYLLIFKGIKQSLIDYCRFKAISVKSMTITIVLAIGANFLLLLLLNLTAAYKLSPDHVNFMSKMVTDGNIIIPLLVIGILVPVFEEILFRGIILNELRKNMHIGIAVVLQALIFGVYHLNLVQGIFTALLALILGVVYVWLDSLWGPIIIHGVYNTIIVILSNYTSDNFNLSGATLVATLVVSSVVVMGTLYLLKENSKKDYIIPK